MVLSMTGKSVSWMIWRTACAWLCGSWSVDARTTSRRGILPEPATEHGHNHLSRAHRTAHRTAHRSSRGRFTMDSYSDGFVDGFLGATQRRFETANLSSVTFGTFVFVFTVEKISFDVKIQTLLKRRFVLDIDCCYVKQFITFRNVSTFFLAS